MMSNEANPPYETLEIGTPRDYSTDMYKVYFEVGEYKNIALNVLVAFLGTDKKESIRHLAHGYEVELPMQCIPEVVHLLSEKNIAIYQIVRYAKTTNSWS